MSVGLVVGGITMTVPSLSFDFCCLLSVVCCLQSVVCWLLAAGMTVGLVVGGITMTVRTRYC
jgi:hypothetical protein